MPIIPLVDKPLEEDLGLVPFCGPVATASVELDCQGMEVELVLLARVIGGLEKVVAEPDKLVLLIWVIEELEKMVEKLGKMVLLAWAIEELGEEVVESGELLVVEAGEPPGVCSYSVNT